MKKIELGSLNKELFKGISRTFNGLSPDTVDYNNSSVRTRFRNFSAFSWHEGRPVVTPSVAHRFNSQQPFHTFYAGAKPAELQTELLASGDVQRILAGVCAQLPVDGSDFDIGFNQIRVIALADAQGNPAPSFHQDSYDYSCHINVARQNVVGGKSIVASSADGADVVAECILNSGEYVFFDDRAYFHTATPLRPIDANEVAFRDMIIIDFLRRREP